MILDSCSFCEENIMVYVGTQLVFSDIVFVVLVGYPLYWGLK
jgi:hypothetical protein